MTNEIGPAFGIIHRPDMTPAELGCCCAANAQAMHEGNLRDLLFDVARVLATNESGLREKIARAIGSLEREPLAAITSLDGTVKEPLICLTVSERDAILALIPPAGDVVVPVASPLERERFLSIIGERLEAAFNAGAEWAQGFDSRREAHGVLDLLSAAPVAPAGEVEPVAWRFKARDGYGTWSFTDTEPTYLNPAAYVTEPLFALSAAPMGMEG